MIATLPMYDPPWLRTANDRLWTAIAERLCAAGVAGVPLALARDTAPSAAWRSPALLLGQTCGYPLVTRLGDAVQLVATPRYAAPGCDGAEHHAAIVVRADAPAAALTDLRGARAGVNGPDSNTGMNLLRAAIAPLAGGGAFFSGVTITGSHARSLVALLAGRVDVAAIDAVTLALLGDRYPQHARRVRILGWTAATPGLPLVAAATMPAATIAALRDALDAVATDPSLRGTLADLRIAGFDRLPRHRYDAILSLEADAQRAGYPLLR